MSGVYGVKTGFTFGAGRCLVTACKKENLDVIVVVLGATTKTMRTSDSIKVLNYVFNNYSNVNIESVIQNGFKDFENHFLNTVSIKKATAEPILELESFSSSTFPLLKNEISNIKVETYFINTLHAPINDKEKIGFLTIKLDDEILKKLDIFVKNKIEKKNFKIYYQELLKNIFNFF